MGGAQSLQCRLIDILSFREHIILGPLGSQKLGNLDEESVFLMARTKWGRELVQIFFNFLNIFVFTRSEFIWNSAFFVFSSASDYYCCYRCVNEVFSLSLGFESILEGLFGPGLVEDLTLFKGKSTLSKKSTTEPFVIITL